MIRFRKFALLLAVAAALFGACRKDTFRVDDATISPDPLTIIETDVMGLVLDESGNPISGAVVHLGNKQTVSDDNGIFKLNGLVNALLPFVRVEKPGYFPSLVSFSAKAGSVGRLKATLRTKTLAAQLNSATGGTANIPGGGSVQFAANGFELANGQPYNGPVSVYATCLDPSQPGIEGLIPGGFLGRSTGGETQVLTSFGMIKVLLETPGGQPLQINKPAEVTIPVPADRVSKAPPTIPLWYIDETTGYWKEEGTATLQGNVYVGTVTHFSWWNCDLPNPVIFITGRVRIGSDHPYVILRVTLNSGFVATSSTTSGGYFGGSVPANQTFLFEAVNECGDVVYSSILGPYSSNTDVGIISITWTSNIVQVQGSLTDCNQQPVTNGYVSFSTNGTYVPYFPIAVDPTTGTFSTTVVYCSGTDITLKAVDLDALLSSAPATLPVSPEIDFGEISVCNNTITLGVTLEFPDGSSKLIPITYAKKDTTLFYRVIAEDIQDGGKKVTYNLTFTGLFSSSNPSWALNTTVTTNGSPVYYNFQIPPNTYAEALALGTIAGEQLIFSIEGITLIERPSNTTFTPCKVTVSAILQ